MNIHKKLPKSPARRMSAYRQRMQAQGLRPVQIWLPDTRTVAFKKEYARQAALLAKQHPAEDDLRGFLDSFGWPEL